MDTRAAINGEFSREKLYFPKPKKNSKTCVLADDFGRSEDAEVKYVDILRNQALPNGFWR